SNVVNGYLNYVEEAKHIEKFTATRFIFSPKRSDFTSKLYAAVLKSFARWALSYREASEEELSPIERQIRNAFMSTSVFGLKQIISIKAKIRSAKPYYKESLSERERDKMLRGCDKPRDRALLALMGWNGLRPMEVLRLQVKDINIKDRKITIWGKGRSKRHKEIISLFKVPRQELTRYLKSNPRKGKLFGNLNYKDLHDLVMHYLDKTGVTKKRSPFSPHSLRHTAGQLLYDNGVPLEFIQRTLRHATMEATLIYARKAIERMYFKKMKRL
ncbi:MAG TPA: site-specific integrase, partial [Cyclobacteriaceae bacterium]|nr:site-specific integrase [Cyclobacteriaceae bacterium]